MTDRITIVGTVGVEPDWHIDAHSLQRSSLRVVSNERRRNAEGKWEDGHANWYRVTCFRNLATNVKASIQKGDRVIVIGKLRLQEFTRSDGSNGTSAEIVADYLGAELTFNSAMPARSQRSDTDRKSDEEQSSSFQPSAAVQAAMAGSTGYERDGDRFDEDVEPDDLESAADAETGVLVGADANPPF